MADKPTVNIEEVHWIDAMADVGWASGDNGLSSFAVVTVGKVVKDDAREIVLAATFSFDDDQTNNRMVIPKDWVQRRRVIGRASR